MVFTVFLVSCSERGLPVEALRIALGTGPSGVLIWMPVSVALALIAAVFGIRRNRK